MLVIPNVSFILNFCYFLVAVFVAFYIPGSLVLQKTKLSLFQRIVLGVGVGMVFWALQGFLFGFVHARFLTYAYLIVAIGVWTKSLWGKKLFRWHKLKLERMDFLLVLIIFLGVIVQLTSVWFVGTPVRKGLFFCCANTRDNIYHIALTNQLVKNMPPQEPGMFGVTVHNYHYLGNLVVAELIRIFHLPLIQTQYQFTNLLISLLFGLSALVFCRVLSLKKSYQAWLLFFLYFGADLIYLLVSVLRREINFSMSSLEDGSSFLNNPPRAVSIVVFFIGLSLFSLWVTKKEKRLGWITAIVFGSLIGFKVYTGYFALAGFSILALYYFFKRKFVMLPPIISAFIISVLIYLPVNRNAGGFYYTGLNIFENFIVQPWMNLIRLEQARLIYAAHNNIPRIIEYESIYIGLYFVSVFGTKILGLFQTKKSLKLLPIEVNILLISGILASLPLGIFFQQTSGGSNSFNFLVSIFIIGSIYTALSCYYWLDKLKPLLKYLFIALIVMITVPRTINNVHNNITDLQKGRGFLIEKNQVAALNYIKNNTPNDSTIAINPKDFPYDYSTSPYISFLADRREYLAGTIITSDHGINMDSRIKVLAQIFKTNNCNKLHSILSKSGINYIMIVPTLWGFGCKNTDSFLKIVYENRSARVYKFIK